MGEQKLPPEDHWLTLAEVRARTMLSTTTIRRHIVTGEFPPPAQLGPDFARWRASWIVEWEATRLQGVRATPQARARGLTR